MQRWESLGLPVRRPNHKDRSAVSAFSEELDEWLRSASSESESVPAQVPMSERLSAKFPARILVVDDNESLLVSTAAMLVREGYEVRTARDGFEALAVLRGGVPDLLVSDLKMTGMSS